MASTPPRRSFWFEAASLIGMFSVAAGFLVSTGAEKQRIEEHERRILVVENRLDKMSDQLGEIGLHAATTDANVDQLLHKQVRP